MPCVAPRDRRVIRLETARAPGQLRVPLLRRRSRATPACSANLELTRFPIARRRTHLRERASLLQPAICARVCRPRMRGLRTRTQSRVHVRTEGKRGPSRDGACIPVPAASARRCPAPVADRRRCRGHTSNAAAPPTAARIGRHPWRSRRDVVAVRIDAARRLRWPTREPSPAWGLWRDQSGCIMHAPCYTRT